MSLRRHGARFVGSSWFDPDEPTILSCDMDFLVPVTLYECEVGRFRAEQLEFKLQGTCEEYRQKDVLGVGMCDVSSFLTQESMSAPAQRVPLTMHTGSAGYGTWTLWASFEIVHTSVGISKLLRHHQAVETMKQVAAWWLRLDQAQAVTKWKRNCRRTQRFLSLARPLLSEPGTSF